MTDKQIIIDGKECKYWFRPNPGDYRKCSLRGENDNCEEIKDCFVKKLLKQLKHKQQECDRLKHDNDYEVGALEKTIDNLTAENDTYRNKAEKFRQALAEIKELIEICNCHNADGCYECKYFDDCEVEGEEIPTRDVCKLILQKISEAKL